jgi:hypothetical protein
MACHVLEAEIRLSELMPEAEQLQSEEASVLLTSALLIAREHELIDARGCLCCGSKNLWKRLQWARLHRDHPDPSAWTHRGPAGDSVIMVCDACGAESQFDFWFRD